MQALTLLDGQLWLGPFASHEANAPAAPELSALAAPAITVHCKSALMTDALHDSSVVMPFE